MRDAIAQAAAADEQAAAADEQGAICVTAYKRTAQECRKGAKVEMAAVLQGVPSRLMTCVCARVLHKT
jgi:hypothetical protein